MLQNPLILQNSPKTASENQVRNLTSKAVMARRSMLQVCPGHCTMREDLKTQTAAMRLTLQIHMLPNIQRQTASYTDQIQQVKLLMRFDMQSC